MNGACTAQGREVRNVYNVEEINHLRDQTVNGTLILKRVL
jgi:hypothetical protein